MKSTRKQKMRLIMTLLFVVTLIVSCTRNDIKEENKKPEESVLVNTVHPTEIDHVVIDEKVGSGYIDNILVLFVKEGVNEEEILSWFPDEEPSIVGRFPGLGQYQVRVRPRKKSELEELANQMMKKEEVNYAHLDLVADTGTQRKMNSEEPPQGIQPTNDKPDNEWWYSIVGLKEAQRYLPEKFVKVAVVDDGFDTSHPDLHLTFPGKEQEKLNLPESHGTHVVGIVQQILPQATLVVSDSYRTPYDDNFSYIGTQCQFMKYLVDLVESDVKVLNYSMGADITEDEELSWNIESSSISSVYVWLLKEKGYDFLLVQSAGNVGIDAYRNGIFCTLNEENCLGTKEARDSLGVSEKIEEAQKKVFESIVVVGGMEISETTGEYILMPETNYGDKVDIVAPGSAINSTVPGGYLTMGGTSQAAPVVTGTLGFLWSLDEKLTSRELKEILLKSSTEFATDEMWKSDPARREKYPIVNILEAVKMVNKEN